MLLQSTTARPIARWLKIAEPEPRGFLIIGADALARAIARELQENDFRVLLTDQNWDQVTQAKMDGLPAYWGNPVSEHAERHLSLIGIGHLLALTPNRELNALAAKHYRLEFGANNIYTIRTQQPGSQTEAKKTTFIQGGQRLFQEAATHAALTRLLGDGAEIKTTPLTDKFSYEDYLRSAEGKRIPLFGIDPGESIHPLTVEREISPRAAWKIIGLSVQRQADRGKGDGLR